jgi:hypothetical protein
MRYSKNNAMRNSAWRGRPGALRFACLALLVAGSFAAAQPASHPAKAARPRAGHPAVTTPAETAPPAPQAPEPPKWPANEAAKQPSITWNSEGLHIQASNANLSQILNQISTQTGAKIEGLSKDERVFGNYGPGQAKDVLAQLLHGSGYDYLMLGDEGQGTPRTVILTVRRNAPPPNQNPAANAPDQQPDDDSVVEPDNDEPEQQPQVFQPPQPQPQQPENPQAPMTPQQRMQLMQQQRLQQMQQMQRQYQQQPQQQPQ